MSQKIILAKEARDAIKRGVDSVANVVKTSMGPRGRLTIFNRGAGPIPSLDGVTIAKQVFLESEAENDGAQLAITAARETDKEAGDGTTCATLLVQSLLDQGLKAIELGIDHTKLKRGMEEARDLVKAEVKKQSKPLKTREDIKNIAAISSRDEEVGEKIANLYGALGKEAVITVEESKVVGVQSEVVDGIELDAGYITPYFMNNVERGEAVLEEPYILCTSQVVMTNQDVFNVMEWCLKERKPLLIIAEDVKGEALATMVMNKMERRFLSCAVKAPGMGDNKRDQIEDIAILTGGKYADENAGMKVEDAEMPWLGKAKRAIVSKDKTLIVGGKGKKQDIKDRISFLKKAAVKETADYQRELKERRAAKLKGGVAVIHVGTISQEENMEKRYRVEDAVRSAKSAMEEGVVMGAGMALYNASKALEERVKKEMDLDLRTGLGVVCQAIKEPARQIILNTNENADVILSKCEGQKGWDSSKGEYCNLIEKGIIDPCKVLRVALDNAVSVVSLFLSTEAIVYNVKEEKEEK